MQRNHLLAIGGVVLLAFCGAVIVQEWNFSPAQAAPAAAPVTDQGQEPAAPTSAPVASLPDRGPGVQLTVHDKQPLAVAEWNQLSALERWNFWKRRAVSLRAEAGTVPELAEELSQLLEVPVLLNFTEDELGEAYEGKKPAAIRAEKHRWNSVRPTPLAELLKQVLIPCKLCVRFEHGMLWIETEAAHESHQLIRVYQVRDLVETNGSPYSSPDFDSLIQLIQSTVDPVKWKNNGGQGDIAPFESNRTLVVSNTFAVLEEVEELLAQLRKHPAVDPIADQTYNNAQDHELTTANYLIDIYRNAPHFSWVVEKPKEFLGGGNFGFAPPFHPDRRFFHVDEEIPQAQLQPLIDFIKSTVLPESKNAAERQLLELRDGELLAVLPASEQRILARWLLDQRLSFGQQYYGPSYRW